MDKLIDTPNKEHDDLLDFHTPTNYCLYVEGHLVEVAIPEPTEEETPFEELTLAQCLEGLRVTMRLAKNNPKLIQTLNQIKNAQK